MRYFRSLAIALSIGVAIPASSHAQSPHTDLLGLLRTDSTAWQRVLVYITSRLSTELVRAAADTTSQPWIIRLPDREPQRALIDRQLRTLLRARPVSNGDSVFHTLEVGSLTILRDTARVPVNVSETRACPGTTRTTGSSWTTLVIVPRTNPEKFWGVGSSGVTRVGDRGGC